MRKYVCGLLFSDDREHVALIHKNKGPWAVVGKWNAIGGKISTASAGQPESADAAMFREFIEETGVMVTNWSLFLILRGRDWEVSFFEVFSSERLALLKTMEEEEVGRFPLKALSSVNVVPNLRWIIPMALGHKNDHVWTYEVVEKDTFAA